MRASERSGTHRKPTAINRNCGGCPRSPQTAKRLMYIGVCGAGETRDSRRLSSETATNFPGTRSDRARRVHNSDRLPFDSGRKDTENQTAVPITIYAHE